MNIIEQMKTALNSQRAFSPQKFSQSNFYSLLVKHQLNMIQAWSSAESYPLTEVNAPNLTEVFLKFNNVPKNVSWSKPNVKAEQVLKTYQEDSVSNACPSKARPGSLHELANNAARANNIPEFLFQKLIQTESAFNPNAVSPRGAMGLGQLMPATARELGLNLKEDYSVGSILHPESNLDASARYFRKLFDKYVREGIPQDEAWSFAAGAYNAGMGNIDRAVEMAGGEKVNKWNQVAETLPLVTGKYSSETIRYVDRLRA